MLGSMKSVSGDAASRWAQALVAVGCPVAATLAASALARPTTMMAAMFYLLAVVVAALIGGQAGGLGASILSFAGLNVFFTPPVGTFRVQKTEDVVALLAFLAVSGLVATLLTRAKAEKRAQLALAVKSARLDAQRRAVQARLDADKRAALAEAEASRIRAALFSSVTHDLRTPLASIKASATSLLDEAVDFEAEQRTELLTTIVEETDRLNRLIGNLLDLSRLRAGALAPSKAPAAIEEVVEGVVARLRALLSGRQVSIRIRDDTPLVPMDVMQIDQVLTNLLENVIKYTPEGSEVQIKAGRWQSSVEVQVADRGGGIPTQDREKVFEEFFRRDVEGHKGGAGLGLSIARAMVIAHGGQMWIKDTPGGGATVGFRLPGAIS